MPAVEYGFATQDRPFFAIFDRVRVECLAADGLPGMASNLADADTLAPSSSILRPLYLCARHLADGDSDAARAFVENWIRQHESYPTHSRLARWLKALGGSSDTQALDAEQVESLAAVLRELLQVDAWRRAVIEDAHAFARVIGPLVQRCGASLTVSSSEPTLEQASIDNPSPSSQVIDETEEDPESDSETDGLADSEAPISRAYPAYTVFNHDLDEMASAAKWYELADRRYLDRLQTIDRRRARQLAHRLQRRLDAAKRRKWQFDQEDGRLDSRRIARLVQAGSDPRVFRRESESPVPLACVSLLVDLSGSMRGDRRLSAALAIDLAVHVLEICDIQCEVLGYSTRYGEDNPIERQWQRSGGLDAGEPGRLNAVRHVVFKSARQPWRRCRPYLGLLLREGFGKENIDGEALHWACQRLFRVNVSRRILIVLSDGAPFDQATATHNGREFLCEHLRTVVQRLDALPLHLLALGTGTDVSRFYRQAVVLDSPAAVAETLFQRLGELLTMPLGRRDSK